MKREHEDVSFYDAQDEQAP